LLTPCRYAVVKYRGGQTDAEFARALVMAARLGPAEPEIQASIANYGLAVWDEVDAATRAAIDGMVAAGMRRNAPEMLQIAQRRGRLAPACRHFHGSPRQTSTKWTQLCQSMEATS
jgi:hypothetical protein